MPASINNPAGADLSALGWVTPDWPAPACVKAGSSTRQGGVSPPPYDSLNLGDHVGDEPQNVIQNRQRLADVRDFPNPPVWLKQVHGVHVVNASHIGNGDPEADASYTTEAGVVCAAMTADCLPVLFCDRQGSVVAAAHAGWRGLADGVLEETVAAMKTDTEHLMAWLGPAIGPQAFEVGDEVRATFITHHAAAKQAFTPSVKGTEGHWMADIYQLARIRLNTIGINSLTGRLYGSHLIAGKFTASQAYVI